MPRKLQMLLTVVALAVSTFVANSATIIQGSSSAYVAFEAESNPTIANGSPAIWTTANDATASGGAVLYIAGTTDNSLAPHSFALYKIKFATPGTYHLYYRFKADAARTVADQFTGNSCLIPNVFGTFTTPGNTDGLPNFHTAASNGGQAPANNVFDWQREAETAAYTVTAADVAAGVPLVLTIGTREAGFTVDRWILSPDPSLTDAALAATENSETSVVTQGANEAYVSFEAEAKATLIAGTPAFWTTAKDAGASGGSVLYIAGTTDNALAPHSFALYQIKFAVAGTYHLYYRFKADAARTVADQFTANSCLIPNVFGTFTTPGNTDGLPNFHTAASNGGQAPANNVFDWQREAETAAYTVTAADVAAGVPLVLTIGTREAGFTVDRWILSTDPALTDPTLDSLPNTGSRVAAPSIDNAVGSASLNTVTLVFTRPLSAASVVASRFSISGGLAITAAALDAGDPRRVTLTTAAQTQGTVYTVTVAGVTDTSGTAVENNTTKTFTAWKLVEGWATQEIYLGIPGATVADLTGSVEYAAGTPSEVRWVKGFQLNNSPRGPNLAAEVSAFFTPAVSGVQNFYVFNDDEAELLLSSNQTFASLQSLNLFVPSVAPAYDDAILAVSPVLTAKQPYLLVGRVKSGGGDFRLSVAAQLASASAPAANLSVLGGSLISTFVNPDIGNVTFTQQPANATAAAGDRAGFSVQVTAKEGPLYYQWRVNGSDIPGATRTTYQTPVLSAADSGKVYSVVVSVAGKDTLSANATLTVQGLSKSTLQPYVGINFVGGGDNLPGSLNSTDVAGVALQENWNNLTGFLFDQVALRDAAGAATPITFSAAATDHWYCGTIGSGDANGVLLQGYISTGASLDPFSLTLNNVPAGNYSVIVYSVGFPFQASYEETFSLTGASVSPTLHVKAESGLEFNGSPIFRRMTSTDENNRGALGNYVQFDNVRPAADGSVAISAAWASSKVGNGHQPAINGIQLVRVVEAPTAPSKKIAWVSFHGAADDAPTTAAAAVGFTKAPDAAYTDLLKANGYAVTRFLSRDEADLSSLSSADLVIISRSVASGHYQQASETAAWNGLAKPVMIMGGYILRSSRLGFTTGSTIPDTAATSRLTVSDPTHPIFAGVALSAGNVMVNPYANPVTHNGTVQLGISVNTDALPSGGKALAVNAAVGGANGGMVVGEWESGARLANTPPSTLGGHRLVFLSGSRESGITSEAAGIYDLAPDGAKMFLNAVAYMLVPAVAKLQFTSTTITSGNLKLEWSGGGTLESATSLTGVWSAVAGAASPHTAPASDAARFYRLRRP